MIKSLLKWAVFSVFVLASAIQTFGQNGTNGVNGGYVGSDRWFAQMRQSAANQAMVRDIAGVRSAQQLPADFVEFAGQIVFSHGKNPFPRGRFPDLRIRPRNQNADRVERAPFVDDEGGFYTVLKRGQTYEFYWMYFAGSKERFAVINIDPDGPRQRKVAIPYSPGTTTQRSDGPSSSPYPRQIDRSQRDREANVNLSLAYAKSFDLSGVPNPPRNFEEQQLLEYGRGSGTSWSEHEKLANYYDRKGDTRRAKAEHEKAQYLRNR